MRLAVGALWFSAMTFAACSSAEQRPNFAPTPPDQEETPLAVVPDASTVDAEAGFESCAAVAVEATREKLPVDIIWIVDNSSSMQPAVAEVQAGLNDFAALVGSKGLDYKVILLSLRGIAPITSGGTRYPVCVPPPLGGDDCGNTPQFFHAPLDVQSTQPLEQFLGTLDQTAGYTQGSPRGSIAWSQELRPNATKSIVLVTDDNSRFPGISFETFPGGDNPNTGGLVLPPGILDPSRGGAWNGYIFSAIYGWGAADPSIRCTYPNGAKPAASGSEYTALVSKTNGVRAQICEGSAAWGPFFDGIATAVLANSRVACELSIPKPDAGTIDPASVNVRVDDGTTAPRTLSQVSGAAACSGAEGWYYDTPVSPTKVLLCPASCEAAQSASNAGKPPRIDVLFGCATLVR